MTSTLRERLEEILVGENRKALRLFGLKNGYSIDETDEHLDSTVDQIIKLFTDELPKEKKIYKNRTANVTLPWEKVVELKKAAIEYGKVQFNDCLSQIKEKWKGGSSLK